MFGNLAQHFSKDVTKSFVIDARDNCREYWTSSIGIGHRFTELGLHVGDLAAGEPLLVQQLATCFVAATQIEKKTRAPFRICEEIGQLNQ